MKLQRFEVPGLAHYSYLLGSRGQGVVIDPKRDIDTYLDAATADNLRITRILETHIHADYASGALELSRATGAELWLSKYDTGEDFEYQFAHREFADGEAMQVGDLRFTALHTPGHTPEHLSFVLSDLAQSPNPLALFSGDFLFVGSLGRPDLLGEAAKLRLAEELYVSVNTRIASLPDSLDVYPAHGAGSLCGSGMGDLPQTTLGYERKANIYFGQRDKQKFIEHILSTVPPFPDYYRRMKKVNSAGPKILGGIPGGEMLAPQEFRALAAKAAVIDLRPPQSFGAGHIPGAFSVGAGASFGMWAPWVVPYDQPILLVGEETTDYEGARRALVRVGLDNVRGSLRGGMKAWSEAGFPQEQVPQISVAELARLAGHGALVLDVRTDAEWAAGHVAGARHIMGGDLAKRTGELPSGQPIHIICGSGYRSSIASSVLRRAGFREVVNTAGGMNAWKQQGLPTVAGK